MNDEEIRKIAHMARIQITDQEIDQYRGLNDILELIEKIHHLDTGDIEPMAHPLDILQPVRDDIVTESNKREQFQAIAPKTEAGLYLVPEVIEVIE